MFEDVMTKKQAQALELELLTQQYASDEDPFICPSECEGCPNYEACH